MRSPVRIWIAAPAQNTLKHQGSGCFFVCSGPAGQRGQTHEGDILAGIHWTITLLAWHKRCGPTAFFVIFAKKVEQDCPTVILHRRRGGGIINLAEKPQNTKREVKIMRRKKLLRQVAAAAVALSMAGSFPPRHLRPSLPLILPTAAL